MSARKRSKVTRNGRSIFSTSPSIITASRRFRFTLISIEVARREMISRSCFQRPSTQVSTDFAIPRRVRCFEM